MATRLRPRPQPPPALEPWLHDGAYVFVSLEHGADVAPLAPVVTVQEEEGVTVVVREEVATARKLRVLFRATWITLKIHTELDLVGLTAAFATALGSAGISCNVVAGAHHDHIFVPVDQAEHALAILKGLSARPSAKDV